MKPPKTILLCEDEEFVARSYTRKLELEGFMVVRAKNGKEALEQVDKALPDLILLDLMMPLMSGFEVLKELRNRSDTRMQKIPVIVASNLGQQSDINEARELGATDFLVKSNTSLKELTEKLRKYL